MEGIDQVDQDRSDNVKIHEGSHFAENSDGGSIEDEKVIENKASEPGDRPEQSRNHSTEDPEKSLNQDQTLEINSIASSDARDWGRGLVMENEGGTEFDVIMVHGLGQDRRSTWIDDISPETTWACRAYPTARILLYGYDTDSNYSNIFTVSGIVEEATRLLQQLDTYRRDSLPKRSMVFISHGLGGLLVKAVLILASKLPDQYAYILEETTSLVFMAYSIGHKPASATVLQENILALLLQDFGEDKYKPGRLMSYVHSLAHAVQEVHGNFVHTKMFIRAKIVNAVPQSFDKSEADELLKRSQPIKRIVYEPGLSWGYNSKFSEMTHYQLARDHKDWLYGSLEETNRKALNGFVSQAPPFYPSSECISPGSISELEELSTLRGGRALHVRCNTNTRNVTDYIGEYLNSRYANRTILQFHFNPHDVRFASLDAMVRAFLSQLAAQGLVSREWSVARMMSYITTLGVSKARDLLFPLSRFILNHGDQLIFVIGGLEVCDGPVQEFIDMLNRRQRDSDRWIRFAILTNIENDSHITEMLSGLPSDFIREWIVDPVASFLPEQEETPFDLSMLPQKLPQFMIHELSSTLRQSLSTLNIEYDHSLSHLLISWLRSTKRPAHVIRETLELLQLEAPRPTPEGVFRALLLSVPQEKQTWAKQILRWVVFSLRPLRVEEICLVAQLVSPQNERTAISDIMCWLGGVLHVEHDEVHFAHTNIRPWLVREAKSTTVLPADEMWCHFDADNASQDHLEILQVCFMYIKSPDEHSTAGFWPTKHVFPYAWQHWTTHYLLAKASGEFPSAQETALAIFQDDDIFLRWIHAYRDLADPLTLFHSQALSPASIAAHFGLDDLLRLLISKKNSDWDVLPPLIEAARKGHLSTFRLLKQELTGPSSMADHRMGQLVEVAASCGQAEVLQEMMTFIPKIKENLDHQDTKPAWLSSVLIRACWMDNKDLAEAMLELGAGMNSTMPNEGKRATNILTISIMANSIDIANLLLEKGYDLNTDTTIIGAAAGWATREMTELLIKKGWNFKGHEEGGLTILQDSCISGNNAVIDVVLRHEANFAAYIDPEVGEPLILAVGGQQFKSVQTLLNYGVNVNVTDGKGNALYHAVAMGNLDLCRLLLGYEKDKIDVDYCAPNSEPPLVKAILMLTESDDGMIQIVKLLLENDADVRRTEGKADGLERTPLLIAAAQQVTGIEEVVKILLSKGSEIEAKDSEGWTSLYTAAYYNNIGVGRLLIEAKADLYATIKEDNLSPLHGAYDNPDFIKLLLDNGLDPMQKYKANITPLKMCAKENIIESLETILESSQDSEEAVLTDALVDAFENFNEESVRLLLDHGANVNHIQEDTNRTLISRAMDWDNNEGMIRLLLEYRPDLSLVDNDENTVLHYIEEDTSVTSVKLLVNATAKLDVLNKRRQSPLTMAVVSQNWDVVRYLVSKTAVLPILNVPGYWGTPLHRACRLGTLDIVRCLVERGADPNFHSEGMDTPLSQACIHIAGNYGPEKEDIIRYLLDKGDHALAAVSSGSPGPMHYASRTCSEAIITLFIEKGADKFSEDDMGRRPLHLACYNSLEAVQALNVPDEEFAARDKVGRVPLHYAVMSAYTEFEMERSPSFLEYVLDRTKAAGLGVDVKDNDGWTPLLWSARRSTMFADKRPRSPLKTFQKLVENGANSAALGHVRQDKTTSSIPEKQWSLVDIATYHGNETLVDHLTDAVDKLDKTSGKASRKVGIALEVTYCDYCYLSIYGEYFECDSCVVEFYLCFKCYGSKDVLHPAHDFVQKGGEMDSSDEQADAQQIVADPLAAPVYNDGGYANESEENIGDEDASELSSVHE